jgi:hypothetical protein
MCDDCSTFPNETQTDFVPPRFIRLVISGRDPETAADIVDTTIRATQDERYGEDAEPLRMVLGWQYGPDTG